MEKNGENLSLFQPHSCRFLFPLRHDEMYGRPGQGGAAPKSAAGGGEVFFCVCALLFPFSVVERVPDSHGSDPAAFLPLGGPGWIALSQRLQLAPGFGDLLERATSGFIRASRVSR